MKKYILAPLLLLGGCAYYQPIGISSTSIGSQYERPSGIAEGVSRRWLFFPCYNACPIGEDSLKAAIADALEGEVGDTLANVYAERRIIAFPHIYFPLIVRSDIVVTGTLVKYNTKEFPPDNEPYLYSASVLEVWNGLLPLNKEEQKRRISTLPGEMKAKLSEYAEQGVKSIKDGSREELLFETITGAKPRKPVTKSFTSNPANIENSGDLCEAYYCMILLSPESQVKRISRLQKSNEYSDQIILGNIVKAAKNRIRACRNGTIFVNPETKMDSGENELLTYLCKEGELK